MTMHHDTTTPDPIDVLRAERPDMPVDSALARRVLRRATAAEPISIAEAPRPRTARRSLVRPAFAIAAVAIAVAVAVSVNLTDGTRTVGIDDARAQAIDTLRTSSPRRFALEIATYQGTRTNLVNHSTLTAWDDDVHYVLGPTRDADPANAAPEGWESIEVDGRSYDRPLAAERDQVDTPWMRDPSRDSGPNDRGSFELEGDALADLLVRLGGTTTELPDGGIAITVTGTARQLAPVGAPDGADDDGRLGLYGLFDPIGDLASEVEAQDPGAAMRGRVRFDAQHRVVEVEAARVRAAGADQVTRRVVAISYDIDPVVAPAPTDVTLAHRPPTADGPTGDLETFGLESAYSTERIAALATRIEASDMAILNGSTDGPQPGLEPAHDAQRLGTAWDRATFAELARDERCAAIDPDTGRRTRTAPADPARYAWRCSAPGVEYDRDEHGSGYSSYPDLVAGTPSL